MATQDNTHTGDDDSNLSETAKEVNPHLQRTYKEMRDEKVNSTPDFYAEMGEGAPENDENLIHLANKITDPAKESGDSEKVDFRIHLADVKSRVLSDKDITPRGKTIRNNFVRKLEKKTIESDQV